MATNNGYTTRCDRCGSEMDDRTKREAVARTIAMREYDNSLTARDKSPASPRSTEEREFLDASVAVWREIDAISAQPEGYTSATALDASTELRKREQATWEAYRATLSPIPESEK